MVLEGVRWDKKEFLESNLHVYGRNDTKIVVYSMRRWTKEKERGEYQAIFCNKTVNFCNFVHEQDIII